MNNTQEDTTVRLLEGAGVEGWDTSPRDQFIMVYEDVWQALKGKPCLTTYMGLKRRVMPDKPTWFGTRKALAEEAGVSVNTFDRHVKELQGMGLVQVIHRYGPRNFTGDPSQVSLVKDDQHPQQIASLFRVRFHMPAETAQKVKSAPSVRADSQAQGEGTPSPTLGRGVSPTLGREVPPKLGNRHRTQKTYNPGEEGGLGSEEKVTGGQNENSPSPELSSDEVQNLAATYVDQGRAQDARCPAHEGVGWVNDPCGPCGAVRRAARALEDSQERRAQAEKAQKAAQVQECGLCDDFGRFEYPHPNGAPRLVKCTHDYSLNDQLVQDLDERDQKAIQEREKYEAIGASRDQSGR